MLNFEIILFLRTVNKLFPLSEFSDLYIYIFFHCSILSRNRKSSSFSFHEKISFISVRISLSVLNIKNNENYRNELFGKKFEISNEYFTILTN